MLNSNYSYNKKHMSLFFLIPNLKFKFSILKKFLNLGTFKLEILEFKLRIKTI